MVKDGDWHTSGAFEPGVLASRWVRPRWHEHLGPREGLSQALGAAAVLVGRQSLLKRG